MSVELRRRPSTPLAVIRRQDLVVAHAALREWCKANGHALAGPSWEIYDHWQPEWDRGPSLIRTDVFYQGVA
jgi:hypothetical protein